MSVMKIPYPICYRRGILYQYNPPKNTIAKMHTRLIPYTFTQNIIYQYDRYNLVVFHQTPHVNIYVYLISHYRSVKISLNYLLTENNFITEGTKEKTKDI